MLGWVTGLIFYFIDKRPFVRFHAAQSIVVFGGLTLIRMVSGMLFHRRARGGILRGLRAPMARLHRGLHSLDFADGQGYQGEKFRVPVAADLADQIFGKS